MCSTPEGERSTAKAATLGSWRVTQCVGIEGSCEGPAAPLVGPDGTTFVRRGSDSRDTIAARIMPSGAVMGGWPYRSDAEHQAADFCPATDVCEGYNVAMPAIGPDNDLYLIHGATTQFDRRDHRRSRPERASGRWLAGRSAAGRFWVLVGRS